jgi:hypothetical protein
MNSAILGCEIEEGEGGGSNLWYVGVSISVLGSIFINLGQNIQKLAQVGSLGS